MKSVEFCYWLQGAFEILDPKSLNENQINMIKRHLKMVFVHEIDLSYPKDQQAELNEIHNEEDTPKVYDSAYGDDLEPRPHNPNKFQKPVMRC